MAKGCKKCDPHEICEECPEWIFTLADLIMCMMGLFVILWCLKPGGASAAAAAADSPSQQDKELIEVIGAIRTAFGYVPDPQSNDPIDVELLMKKLDPVRRGQGEKGKTEREIKGAEGTDPEVTSIRIGKQAIVGGRLMFDRGAVALSRETVKSLDQIASQIRGHRNVVVIKGHASLDDFPDGASAEEKMALSVQRAKTAADYLIGKGVEPEILRVQGCSTYEPVASRVYKPESQSVNRRVEVEVTPTLVEELQDPTSIKRGAPLKE
jgi:outer membrane protein OmpA-like peptidoglycan-associated protein